MTDRQRALSGAHALAVALSHGVAGVRTVFEDDLISSGRLGAFASALGKDERDALGWLMFAYKDTQRAMFYRGDRQKLKRVLTVRFGTDSDRVIDALIDSLLADYRKDKMIEIRGNKNHVVAFKNLKHNASRGGYARAGSASRRKDGTFNPAQSSRHPAGSSAITIPNTITITKESKSEQIPINERPQQDMRALMLGKKYLERRGRIGQKLTPQEAADMQAICDAAGDSAESAMNRFLDDERDFYTERKWALKWLLRDLAEHLEEAKPKAKTWYNPITDEHLEIKGI